MSLSYTNGGSQNELPEDLIETDEPEENVLPGAAEQEEHEALLQDYFDALAGNIAFESRKWHDGRQHSLATRPVGISSLLDEAAKYNFLYDIDGGWVTSSEDYDRKKNPTGDLYLHHGDKTYLLHLISEHTELIEEDGKLPKLKPVEPKDLPKTFIAPVTGTKTWVKPTKPELNAFWSAINAVCRFFTGGKYGLPSVNKYESELKAYEDRDKPLREKYDRQKATLDHRATIESNLHKPAPQKSDLQKSDLQKSDLQQSDLQKSDLQQSDPQKSDLQKSDPQKSDLQPAPQKDFAQKLLDEMQRYIDDPKLSISYNTTCSRLYDTVKNMRDRAASGELPKNTLENTCSLLAPYFIKSQQHPHPNPDILLGSLSHFPANEIEERINGLIYIPPQPQQPGSNNLQQPLITGNEQPTVDSNKKPGINAPSFPN